MDVISLTHSQNAISLYDITVFSMYRLYVYTVFFQYAKAFGCMYTVEQHTIKIKKKGKTL